MTKFIFLIVLPISFQVLASEEKKSTSMGASSIASTASSASNSSNNSSSLGVYETMELPEPVNDRMFVDLNDPKYSVALEAITALKKLNPTTAVTVIQQFVHELPREEQLQVAYGAERTALVNEKTKKPNPNFNGRRIMYDINPLTEKEQEAAAAIFLLTNASLEAHQHAKDAQKNAKLKKTQDGRLPSTPTHKKRSCVIS